MAQSTATHSYKIENFSQKNQSLSPFRKPKLIEENKNSARGHQSKYNPNTNQINKNLKYNPDFHNTYNETAAIFDPLDINDDYSEFSEKTPIVLTNKANSPNDSLRIPYFKNIHENTLYHNHHNHPHNYSPILSPGPGDMLTPYSSTKSVNPFSKTTGRMIMPSFERQSTYENPKESPKESIGKSLLGGRIITGAGTPIPTTTTNATNQYYLQKEFTRKVLKNNELEKRIEKALKGKKAHLKIIRRKMPMAMKNALENDKIINKIISYLNLSDCVSLIKSYRKFMNDKELKKVFINNIFNHLKNNVKSEELYDYFRFFVNFPKIMRLHSFSYQSKANQSSIYERDISYDLDRTFADNTFFETSSGKESLKRVLTAISNTEKEVGYVQGLNCIVGTLLLNLSEEESFWTLLYLMEKMEIKELFNHDFKHVNVLNYQLHYFTEHYLPEISNYLKERNMEVGYFSTSWFITLFSCVFSHQLTIKIWCVFLLKGYPFLIQLALAIFAIHKDNIIMRECDEAGEYLKNTLKNTEMNVFELSIKFKVTKRLLDGLEQFYDEARKIELKLTPIGKKLEWREYIGSNQKVESKLYSDQLNQSMNIHHASVVTLENISKETILYPSNENNINSSPKFFDSLVNVIKISFTGKIKNLFTKESNQSIASSSFDSNKGSMYCVETKSSAEITNTNKHNGSILNNNNTNSPQKTQSDNTTIPNKENPIRKQSFQASDANLFSTKSSFNSCTNESCYNSQLLQRKNGLNYCDNDIVNFSLTQDNDTKPKKSIFQRESFIKEKNGNLCYNAPFIDNSYTSTKRTSSSQDRWLSMKNHNFKYSSANQESVIPEFDQFTNVCSQPKTININGIIDLSKSQDSKDIQDLPIFRYPKNFADCITSISNKVKT